ncbi:MAG TPA: hypothetical protein VFW96_09585 [Thermomicrobiales bacterium]|nr:hypothetical protein [Thermomicrobiales bacterium]
MSQNLDRERMDRGDPTDDMTRVNEARDVAAGEPVVERDTVVRSGPVAAARPRETTAAGYATAPSEDTLEHNRIHWGAVWAGFFVAFFVFLVMEFLGLAIGMTVTGKPPSGFQLAAEVWTAVFAFVSYLVGGYAAGKTAAVFDRQWGAVNGFMVFLLTVPIALLATGLGVGAVLGVGAATVSTTAGAANTTQIAATTSGAAWTIFVVLCVGFIASGIGGWLGTRAPLPSGRPVRRAATAS